MKRNILILLVIIMTIFGFLVSHIRRKDQEIKQTVYTLLEKENLTFDEKEFINLAIDPDEMKESYVYLDDKHYQLYQKHFSKN